MAIKYKTITVEELLERKQDIGTRYDKVFFQPAETLDICEVLDIDFDRNTYYRLFLDATNRDEPVAWYVLDGNTKVLCVWTEKKYYALRGVYNVLGDPAYPSSYDEVDTLYCNPDLDDIENIIEDLMNIWWEKPHDVQTPRNVELFFDYKDGEPDRFLYSRPHQDYLDELEIYGTVGLMDVVFEESEELYAKIWLEFVSDDEVQENWELWESAII